MKILLSSLFNLVIFNVIWIACVLGREAWLWLVVPLVVAYVAMLLARGVLHPLQLFIPALIGVTIDLLLTMLGLFRFEQTSWLLPLWLIMLWIAFVTTLPLSLEVIGRSKLVAGLAGALAFPLNYSVGRGLDAVIFPESLFLTVTVLGIIWAAGLPLLFVISQHCRRAVHVTI